MKIEEYKYGKIIYADCMNEENGLPTLKNKSFDVCLADPPYGEGLQGNKGNIGGKGKVDVTYYPIANDTKFSIKQFNEIKKITNNQVLFGGNYYDFLEPTNSWIVWDKKKRNNWEDTFSDGELAWTSFNHPLKIFRYLYMGALKEKKEKRYHPFQKPVELIRWIIKRYNPTSILDPFAGTGVVAQVATELGIPFLCYEINEEFSEIIQNRLKNCRSIKDKYTNLLEC
jgi:site-specific DNA-methyltransferase (adenine-specific)